MCVCVYGSIGSRTVRQLIDIHLVKPRCGIGIAEFDNLGGDDFARSAPCGHAVEDHEGGVCEGGGEVFLSMLLVGMAVSRNVVCKLGLFGERMIRVEDSRKEGTWGKDRGRKQ